MNHQREPYVFILDLDGTIIGDCTYQCDIYNLQELIKNNANNANSANKGNKIHQKDFVKSKALCEKHLIDSYDTKSLLIRPYFFQFISAMKKLYPSCYFYIYTASEKTWAHKEINIIERQNNFKFNRPIFTRDNCIADSSGNLKKSVTKIMPLLLKSMKMPKDYDIRKKLMIIDNNPTFIDYKENFLLCPTYNYIKFHNLWDGTPEEYYKCSELNSFINKMISLKKVHGLRSKKHETQEKIYKWLYKKHKNINRYNSSFANDNFWKDLTILIKHYNVREYNKKILFTIQKSIKN
jgi:hypothetical protein